MPRSLHTRTLQQQRPGKRVRLQAPSNNERPSKRRHPPASSATHEAHTTHFSDTSRIESGSEPGEPPHELDEDDNLNEVIVAIDMRNRDTIGCSYYVAREEKLHLLNDVKYGGVDIVEACEFTRGCPEQISNALLVRTFIEPTVVLVSSRVDESVHEHLDPEERNSNSRDDDSRCL